MTEPYFVHHTLVIVKSFTKILLGKKKRGFGEGKWNCFGGKVEPGEKPATTAVRERLPHLAPTTELREECGLRCPVELLTLCGTLELSWLGQPEMSFVYVFKADEYKGEIVETEEMRPKWFLFHKIPYHQMWNSDRLWLPLAIENKVFRGHYLYNKENGIVESNTEEL